MKKKGKTDRDVSPGTVPETVTADSLKVKSIQIDVDSPTRRYPFSWCACGCQTLLLAYNQNGQARYFLPKHKRGEFTSSKWKRPEKDTRPLEMLTYAQAVERGAYVPVSDIRARLDHRAEVGAVPRARRTKSTLDIASHIKPKQVKEFVKIMVEMATGKTKLQKLDRNGKVITYTPGPSESALTYLLNQIAAKAKETGKTEGGSEVHVYLPARDPEPEMPPEIAAKVATLRAGEGITIDEDAKKLDTGGYAPDADALAEIEKANE